MSDNKRTGRGIFGKGYYIALILCAAAIGITSYVYYRNAGEEPVSLPSENVGATVPANVDSEDVAVIATQPQGQKPTTPATEPTKPDVKQTLRTMSPVTGETVTTYSVDALSYNQTTRDWRVHNGIDIAAEAGAPVCAAADGEVYTIYEDDSMGYTVVIRHLGGYTTKYSSLGEDLSVSIGDQVAMGQTIGTVGETALVETVLGPHVHFSVTSQDLPMDPVEFLSMG